MKWEMLEEEQQELVQLELVLQEVLQQANSQSMVELTPILILNLLWP